MLVYQILVSTIDGKIWKNNMKTMNLKYQLQRGIKNLNYLMDHILHQIFNIISSMSTKKYETITDNFQMTIFVNQIENRITCRINTGYYLKLLTRETMKH